ncbi:amidase domain-containing protein [Desulfofundulus sp.]|uniref:amidase domain-containing protein n=1 Tax=Desulfofundulus sp. TaxID=2282750 RepID=UPI003C730D9C
MSLHKIVLALIIVSMTGLLGASNCRASDPQNSKTELETILKQIFEARAGAIITGADPTPALTCYDTGTRLGLWALAHEEHKLNFVQQWAKMRGVRFVEAKPSIHITWSRIRGDTAEFVVHQSLQLGYVYPGDPAVNRFGIGTRHWMELIKKDGKWLIRKDFYTDGLGDDTLVPVPTPADGPARVGPVTKSPQVGNYSGGIFDRQGAARYADKYAGLAWGAGNDHKYNPRYRDLNGNGGDCTNFVSQCLGDKEEGGKLPMDGTWYYRYDRNGGSGSRAWVQTEAFANWLLYSGRARRIARGTFQELNQPGNNFPRGAVRELQIGDVIGYEEKGHIEHFAIVVGTDHQGYPVVDAHTVDRYHCPWDMGWDKKTVFHLFRINNGSKQLSRSREVKR